MSHRSDSRSPRKEPIEILKETFGQDLEHLSRENKFTLIALLGQVGRTSLEKYLLVEAYRDLPGNNIPENLFELLPELSKNLNETNLLKLIKELIEKLKN